MPQIISKKTPIRELIIKFQNKKGEKAPLILELLLSTHEFLLRTGIQFDVARQSTVVTPDSIQALLSRTAKSLKKIVDAPATDDELNAVLGYCKQAIEDQLEELYKKNDKVAKYYENHKNELKDVLNPKKPG